MLTSPLVMPKVITGLSLLLLFVALERATGWPQGRGILTITLAHITLGLSYVAVAVFAAGRLLAPGAKRQEAPSARA